EHLIAARSGGVEIMIRVITVWAASDARDKSRLGQRERGHVFVEIDLRRFADAVDGKARLLTQINLIAVEREDLLFAQPRLKDDRHVGFGKLAAQRILRREQQVLDQLLRDA